MLIEEERGAMTIKGVRGGGAMTINGWWGCNDDQRAGGEWKIMGSSHLEGWLGGRGEGEGRRGKGRWVGRWGGEIGLEGGEGRWSEGGGKRGGKERRW